VKVNVFWKYHALIFFVLFIGNCIFIHAEK
jgi:hypothetical protein